MEEVEKIADRIENFIQQNVLLSHVLFLSLLFFLLLILNMYLNIEVN